MRKIKLSEISVVSFVVLRKTNQIQGGSDLDPGWDSDFQCNSVDPVVSGNLDCIN